MASRCPACPTCAVETDAPAPVKSGAPVNSGAWSEWRSATPEVTSIGALIRAFLEPKRKFASFVVRKYREQVVAGTNYAINVQADDFDIAFDVYESASGAIQIKTPSGLVSLRRALSESKPNRSVCPRKCTNYGRTGQGRQQRVDSCGKYINGFGLCGDATDWGPGFLQKADLTPFVDCTRC